MKNKPKNKSKNSLFSRLKVAMALIPFLIAVPQASSARSFEPGQGTKHQETSTYYQLQRYYRDWQGVRYEYGGTDKRGVDCSGFVYRFYRDRLGMLVPRSTALISRISHRVRPSQLEAGDIVIFRISGKGLHVGIYLSEGTFMHASKSKGVMKSSLSNPYWASHYQKAVRVI